MTAHLAFLGMFVGCVLGGFAEGLSFGDRYVVHFGASGLRWPVFGSAIGAAVFAVLAVLVGQYEFKGWIKSVLIGTLIGAVAGALIGAFVVAPLLASFDDASAFCWSKVEAVYQRVCVLLGAPIGAAVGGLIGVFLSIWPRRSKVPTGEVTDDSTSLSESRVQQPGCS